MRLLLFWTQKRKAAGHFPFEFLGNGWQPLLLLIWVAAACLIWLLA